MIDILKLTPVFKDYIWGGNRLKSEFNKKSNLENIAESWELACHKNGTNFIENKKELLSDYILSHPNILGKNAEKFSSFPILIKLIDAKNNLSIQVHPNDNYAKTFENSYGKTEMWYVVDCAEDSFLYYGFKKEISKDEFKERIQNNTLTDVLNKVNIKKGDFFFIDSGTIHAICANTLIAEIQQNSDITYRVYDYGRLGKDGKPRELHIEKAVDVTSLTVPTQKKAIILENNADYTKTLLAKSEYFEVNKYKLNTSCMLSADSTSFHSLLFLNGSADIENHSFIKGDSILIPADSDNYKISGECEFLLTYIPNNI